MLYKVAVFTLFAALASAQEPTPSAASSSLASAASPGIPITAFSSDVSSSAASLSSSVASAAQPSASAGSSSAGGQTLLAELSDNLNYTTFAAAVNASSPQVNLTAALSDPSRELTILLPPSDAFLAAANSQFVSSLRANISETESVPLLDALLAMHILNGSFSAETIATALRASIEGLSVPSLLAGAELSIFGFLAGGSEATPSASSSSAAPSASASAGSSSARIFVNNALVMRPNVLQVGNSYVHEISNVIDPFLPLLGQTLPESSGTSAPSVLPTWIVAGANATASAAPTSSSVSSASRSVSAPSALSSSSSASGASISPDALGPIRPSTSALAPSASAPAKRWMRWEDTY